MSRRKRKELPGVTSYLDRHGRRRWRYRCKGFSAALGTEYGTDAFVRAYETAVAGRKPEGGAGQDRTRPGSLSALVASFMKSPTYRNWAPLTRRGYGGVMEKLREKHGHKRIAHLHRRHVMDLMAEKADTPDAANRVRKVLAMLLDHAIALDWRTDNPARVVKPFKVRSAGFHTWTEDEILRFYEVHKLGTVAHTVMTLMLYTGAARVDVVRLGWGNLRDNGRLLYRRQKTENQTNVEIDIPVHPALAEVLGELPRDAFTFLQTRSGAARSPNGLGNMMRAACDAAGLSQCSSHGLRKACARRLAEAGATPHEIAAVTGHATLAEVERYARAADRSGLADAGFAKLSEWSKSEQKLANHPLRFAKSRKKPK